MSTVSRYWQLQRLNSSGQCRPQPFDSARTWLYAECAELTEAIEVNHRALQTRLLADWQQAEITLALLCLRCFVSHAIRQACLQLVNQFGDFYQFRGSDLFPLVLDDDGQPIGRYRPLSVRIVETYAPDKASLASWAMHLTRNHSELNQFLIERGLYRVSDWAILNDTSPGQLSQVLGEFHSLTLAEVEDYQDLLDRYHQVYRRDRLQQQGGKRGRCQPPSDRQLHEIDGANPPEEVLAKLRQLAYWLREYRVYARGGSPWTDSLEALNAQQLPESQSQQSQESDRQQDAFLDTYRQQLETALAEATAETLRAYCEKLKRKKQPKDRLFLKALELFHCEGKSMKAIAPRLHLKNQVQVTRLMNLKRLRADVRNALLARLQRRVRDAVVEIASAERLHEIGDRLDALLAEETDRLVADAESEAKIPQNRTSRSLFARQICKSLHEFSQ